MAAPPALKGTLRVLAVLAVALLSSGEAPAGPGSAAGYQPGGVTPVPALPPCYDPNDTAFVEQAGDLEIFSQTTDIGLSNALSSALVRFENDQWGFANDVVIRNEGTEDMDFRGVFMVWDIIRVNRHAGYEEYFPTIVPTVDSQHGGGFQIKEVVAGPQAYLNPPHEAIGLPLGFVVESPSAAAPDPDILGHTSCVDQDFETPTRAYDLSALGVLPAPVERFGVVHYSEKVIRICHDLTFHVNAAPRSVLGNWSFCGDFFKRVPCEEVVVDGDAVIDLSTDPPTLTGESELLPYFTWQKIGVAPWQWKAVLDVGPRDLRVAWGGAIRVLGVVNEVIPGNPHTRFSGSPRLEIRSGCSIRVDEGGSIHMPGPSSQTNNNTAHGGLRILAERDVSIRGRIELRTGLNAFGAGIGLPAGDVTIASREGSIELLRNGPHSAGWISTHGVKGGDINLVTCGLHGDIFLDGILAAQSSTAGERSCVRVVSYAGEITANRPLVRARGNGARIELQALGDITVWGNTGRYSVSWPLSAWWGATWGSFAAKPAWALPLGSCSWQIGIGTTCYPRYSVCVTSIWTGTRCYWVRGINWASLPAHRGIGHGRISVKSLAGRITATGNCFDTVARYNANGSIELAARDDVVLAALQGDFGPVRAAVASSGSSWQSTAGTNVVRSHSGEVIVGDEAYIDAMARFWSPTNQFGAGTNRLISCQGVTVDGTVEPAPSLPSICSPQSPAPLYTDCTSDFGIVW